MGQCLEVQRAPGLFEGNALHGVGVNHGGPYIAVPQELLDRSDVVVGLKQVTGEAVANMPSPKLCRVVT